jgi:hypothetical protein
MDFGKAPCRCQGKRGSLDFVGRATGSHHVRMTLSLNQIHQGVDSLAPL